MSAAAGRRNSDRAISAPGVDHEALRRWRQVTADTSDSCERVLDVARSFALGRGSDVVRIEHFVWALFYNGRHSSTASFLAFAESVDVPKLLRIVTAACHAIAPVAPGDATLAPKLLEALSVARNVVQRTEEDQGENEDDPPKVLAQTVLAILLLDTNNFAARALREALPGERGQRAPAFHRLRSSMLAHFEITDEDEIRQISRGLRRAEDADAPAEVPEEYTCPISGEPMVDPVTTAVGQTYDRANIERWLRDHNTDPLTNARLRTRELTPNHALRSLIKRWTEMRDEAEIPPLTPLQTDDTPTSTPTQTRSGYPQ